MCHAADQLKERNINIPESVLWKVAKHCPSPTAVILAKLPKIANNSTKDYHARKESNGDLIILIVRDMRPVTIMFRRSNQKMSPASMRVNFIMDLRKDTK